MIYRVEVRYYGKYVCEIEASCTEMAEENAIEELMDCSGDIVPNIENCEVLEEIESDIEERRY